MTDQATLSVGVTSSPSQKSQKNTKKQNKGKNNRSKISIKRYFTKEGSNPFDEVEWKKETIVVRAPNGHETERELEFPVFWDDSACKIAGSKYFRGTIGSDDWESSARQMISRVVKEMRKWALKYEYFDTKEEADIFADELTYILLHQHAAFNSPVWFNVGIDDKPQCSACFILSVEDNMPSILEWISTEGMIFKRGSGAGINLSNLRGSNEKLKHGGFASGPHSFMRGADSVAGMISSGGQTRRAAKMVVLDVDHPDIMSFIKLKANEEDKVRAFMEAGYNMSDLNEPAWQSIQYQNANNSVRVTDDFMRAVERDADWSTKNRKGGIHKTYKAKGMWKEIAEAAWKSGDPGIQYDTTINDWHTCPNTDRINASNPCSEYMHVNNSACNLASINLLKYLKDDDSFDTKSFKHVVDVVFLAQEVVVTPSKYPTDKIGENTRAMRQIGMGYANLGALLMSMGLAYDSPDGRAVAGAITALMTGRAYRMSAEIAKRIGTFDEYEKNEKAMIRVITKHKEKLDDIEIERVVDPSIFTEAAKAWDEALSLGTKHGYRNAQATVLAPTGTIAFMMGCATTGVEPAFALVAYKNLVGGGMLKIVNSSVPRALRKLGYDEAQVERIVAHIEQKTAAEGAPDLKEEHLPVFDTAVKPAGGERSIHWQGHVNMVAAAQPFISGAISKTFNMPHDTTASEIADTYMEAWRMGIKAIAVYRDGCKAAQPLVTAAGSGGGVTHKAKRRYLPPTRISETHKFSVLDHSGYLTYGMFEDGTPGEIFIRMNKQGSTLGGLLDQFAIAVSVALQYGVPLKTLVRKFSFARYEPSGFTKNPDIQIATSITDYVFRFLAKRFLQNGDLAGLNVGASLHPDAVVEEDDTDVALPSATVSTTATKTEDTKDKIYSGGVCKQCGGMMIQTGTCKTCSSCGASSGGC